MDKMEGYYFFRNLSHAHKPCRMDFIILEEIKPILFISTTHDGGEYQFIDHNNNGAVLYYTIQVPSRGYMIIIFGISHKKISRVQQHHTTWTRKEYVSKESVKPKDWWG